MHSSRGGDFDKRATNALRTIAIELRLQKVTGVDLNLKEPLGSLHMQH